MNKKIIVFVLIVNTIVLNSMQQQEQITNNTHNCALIRIAHKRNKEKTHKNKTLNEAKQLLENGADPDDRKSDEYPTALMVAVYNNDKEYAKLLLQYKANPYKTAQYPNQLQPINAFEMNACKFNDKNWLQEMFLNIVNNNNKND